MPGQFTIMSTSAEGNSGNGVKPGDVVIEGMSLGSKGGKGVVGSILIVPPGIVRLGSSTGIHVSMGGMPVPFGTGGVCTSAQYPLIGIFVVPFGSVQTHLPFYRIAFQILSDVV